MKRNYGIDLLKMLLMFMIVVLHVIGLGGVLSAPDIRAANYCTAWTLEVVCYCAANCYALITGYVHYNRKYRIHSLLMICLQMLFYSVLISGIFWIVKPGKFTLDALLNTLFPVSRSVHWYISSYVGLYLFIPLLNAGAEAMTRNQAKYYLAASMIIFSIIPTFLMADPYKLSGGYSTIWLMHLYLTGAFVKKFGWETRLSRKQLVMIFSAAILVTLGVMFSLEAVTRMIFGEPRYSNLLVSYVSPTIVLSGLSLFLYFLTIRPSERIVKYLRVLSPAAFGVTIIHVHPYIYELWADRFVFLAQWNPLVMALGIIVCALGIYVPCLLIDYLRIRLFDKLNVKESVARVSDRLYPEQIR